MCVQKCALLSILGPGIGNYESLSQALFFSSFSHYGRHLSYFDFTEEWIIHFKIAKFMILVHTNQQKEESLYDLAVGWEANALYQVIDFKWSCAENKQTASQFCCVIHQRSVSHAHCVHAGKSLHSLEVPGDLARQEAPSPPDGHHLDSGLQGLAGRRGQQRGRYNGSPVSTWEWHLSRVLVSHWLSKLPACASLQGGGGCICIIFSSAHRRGDSEILVSMDNVYHTSE